MFDSGFGGLTVARAVIDLLPSEDLVYLGDTARYPYGPRRPEEVRAFASQIAKLLIDEHSAKLIVIACGTATAVALDLLRMESRIPVVGVVEPGVRALVRATSTGRVAVMATTGTIASGKYQRAVADSGADLDLTCVSCPGLAEFVENGETSSAAALAHVERLLAPVVAADVDAILLGCTHFPYLTGTIRAVLGPDVELVSPADETAAEVRTFLREEVGPRAVRHRFLSSGDSDLFADIGFRLFGPELVAAEHIKWREDTANLPR